MTRLRRLSSRDLPYIASAYWYLLVVGVRLFVMRQSTETWIRQFATESRRSAERQDDQERVERAARWVNTAARYPVPWARCLQRSIALCWLLDSRGVSPALRVGIRRSGDSIDAHAWVEHRGRIVNDTERVGVTFTAFSQPEVEPAQRVSDESAS